MDKDLMQIVINIPKEMYQKIKETNMVISGRRSGKRFDYILFNAVNNGIPLPKGHGRLIDADVLVDGMEDDYEFCEAVNATPTIIKPERGE